MRFNDLAKWRTAHGLGLVSAIFLITVIALLALAITRSVRTSAESTGQEVVASRAYWAAESGAQLLAQQSLAGTCSARSFNFSVVDQPGCTADVSCNFEPGGVVVVTSRGRCGDGGQIVAERVIRAVLR